MPSRKRANAGRIAEIFLALFMSFGFASTVWMARDDRHWGQRATYLIYCAVAFGGLALFELLALAG
jgi:hypothetical protein